MAYINIAGVRSESKGYTVHIVLTQDKVIDEETPVVTLGEAFLVIPIGTEMADVKARIIKAAEGIWKAHKDSLDKRQDLEEIDFPPIQ